MQKMPEQFSTCGRRDDAVTGATRCSRFYVVSATPASSSTAWTPTQQRLDILATEAGEKCGLGAGH